MNKKKRESRLRTIQLVMITFRHNFGRKEDWVQHMKRSWAAKLLHLPQTDEELIDIMDNMCTKHYVYPNTVNLSDYLKEIEKYVGENGGTGLTGNVYEFCPDCEHSSGVIDTCTWYVKDGQEKVRSYCCSCTCSGARAKYSKMLTWQELKQNAEQSHMDGSIELVHFYHTSRRMQRLPYSITNPIHHAQVQARLEEDAKQGIPNPNLTIVATMVTGSGIQMDNRGNVIGEKYIPPEQPKIQPQPQLQPTTNTHSGMSDEEFWRNH
jgi:hypothetical protein|tara:strand:+ start:3304 stop:4098 length:795 start_codon:yes stop_codon:yes gene_type:complete